MLSLWHKRTMKGTLSEAFAAVKDQLDGDGSVSGRFRGR